MTAGDCGEYRVLQNQPRAKEAMVLLRKLHSLVKPIMKAHGWFLPLLIEFFPENACLLGTNWGRGNKICIRLRPANDPYSFLPMDDCLIGTMLHELTHNVRSPHDTLFYAQLDKLQDEYDKLRATGYDGEGFYSEGRAMGGGRAPSSVREGRLKAAASAGARGKTNRILGTGGRLGGSSLASGSKDRSPRELAAEAAERRIRDSRACKAHESSAAEIEKAERDSQAIDIDRAWEPESSVEILDDDDDEVIIIIDKKGKGKQKAVVVVSPKKEKKKSIGETKKHPVASTSKSIPIKRPHSPAASSASTKTRSKSRSSWRCLSCTFHNTAAVISLLCEICGDERTFPGIDSNFV